MYYIPVGILQNKLLDFSRDVMKREQECKQGRDLPKERLFLDTLLVFGHLRG